MTEHSTSPPPWYIAIGASGSQGIHDLQDLMAGLPASLNAVVLIVLHRPWDKLSQLRNVLSRSSALPVVIAADGEKFEKGIAYIGEPAEHLTLAARTFGALVDDPGQSYRNRTVDLLFHSVAEHGHGHVIGVILSGSLDDGARGLAAINHSGGLTMVVTPSQLHGKGMPEHAIAYDGHIDFIGSAHEIATRIAATCEARVWVTPR